MKLHRRWHRSYVINTTHQNSYQSTGSGKVGQSKRKARALQVWPTQTGVRIQYSTSLLTAQCGPDVLPRCPLAAVKHGQPVRPAGTSPRRSGLSGQRCLPEEVPSEKEEVILQTYLCNHKNTYAQAQSYCKSELGYLFITPPKILISQRRGIQKEERQDEVKPLKNLC